ncbi:MAG: transporter substrate-binding domain-containing protein [Alphaproteobacteria bacterium]|nr:transporter substrate-binding domain-containing protein [Alphaproteobacteria bacterium]
MKKILLTIFSISLCLSSINNAHGFVRYEEKHPKRKIELDMGGFIDYAPFGWSEKYDTVEKRGGFSSVFMPIIDMFTKDANVEIDKSFYVKDVDELVQKVRSGEMDFFVGAYNETETFRGLHLLYPAVVYNPITVFMLPNRIHEVKSTEDLKNLKGVRNTNELFSDFVNNKVAEFNLIEVDSAYAAFEKLYTREADYMISSYYNGMIEAIKLGLKQQIAPAKQTLWRIPMFIGVSKTSRNREMISKRITKYLNDKNNIKAVEQYLQTLINDFSKRYEGVVPPTFVQEQKQ